MRKDAPNDPHVEAIRRSRGDGNRHSCPASQRLGVFEAITYSSNIHCGQEMSRFKICQEICFKNVPRLEFYIITINCDFQKIQHLCKLLPVL